ncbi:MAG TPA: hypothetical protein VHO25_10095 [Polyangiaceae bacterium]|nr:hypothetical protein [Polyangiaceae bacterium]
MADKVKLDRDQMNEITKQISAARGAVNKVSEAIAPVEDKESISHKLAGISELIRNKELNVVIDLQPIVDVLVEVRDAIKEPPPQPTIKPLTFSLVTDRDTGFTLEGDITKMILKNTQQARVTAKFASRLGGPAKIQAGTAVWTANAPTGCFTVEADPNNELSAIVKANPQANGDDADIGTVDLTVDGDAGEGVKEMTAQAAVSVLPGDAETVALEEATAEEQA